MYPSIPESWLNILKPVFDSEEYQNLRIFLKERYESTQVFPEKHNIYRALKVIEPTDVKVVILGAEPYRTGAANGLAYSVPSGVPATPELRAIFKAIENNFNFKMPKYQTSLEGWAEQGVLLLNCLLTSEQSSSLAHNGKWDLVVDQIIKSVGSKGGMVFMLWGEYAKTKRNLIPKTSHILESNEVGSDEFYFCSHFAAANAHLIHSKQKPIDWSKVDSFNDSKVYFVL